MLQLTLYIVIILSAIPIGYLLAWLCKDELETGRKWFKYLALSSAFLAAVFSYFSLPIALALVFVSLATIISIVKSYDEDFIK